MTVAYSSAVATATYSTFLHLLFMWKGSVYRLIWFELLVFMGLYTVISLTYRYLLTGVLKTYFELACMYCNKHNDIIPVPFVLGFYVAMVVGRWWEQFLELPWPDQIALYLTAYCHGNRERPTRIRRTIMRYVNLCYCLALRAVSSRARLRFPTEEHLVISALDFVKKTATIVVYSYFISCLLSWQYLDPSKNYPGYEIDLYVPVFGFLRFFFYMGWLKVAESLINPFGEDVDDFEMEYLIERNLNVSYLIVDGMHHEHPDLVKDAFWGTTDTPLPDGSRGTEYPFGDETTEHPGEGARFIGSLANLDIAERRRSTLWRRSSLVRPFSSFTNLRKMSKF
ncbi:unnamed protein product [Dicrocoelium dendriticum]|nr:unnamed protein product [Dicrocoelium dendriticum]